VSLCIPSSSRSPDHDPRRTIYYLGYPLRRFADLKHGQLAHQVGVIITTGRIRRTLVNKINLLVDSPRSIEASRFIPVKAESIFLRRASGYLGTSRCSSRGSSLTNPPRAGSSSTTSPPPRVRVPRHGTRHIARLITRLVAPLVVDYSASHRLVVDYFASAARRGAWAPRAAHHAALCAARCRLLRVAQARRRLLRLAQARRRQLCLAQARRRLLRLRRAYGCLGTSCGSSRGSSRRSSSTTPPRAG
jgi:hypothetical protein